MMSARRIEELAAQWLPGAQFSETHAIVADGDPKEILDTINELDDKDDLIVRVLLRIREAPSRFWGRIGGKSGLTGRPRFGLQEFTHLHRDNHAVAYGLAGRFWKLDFGLVRLANPQAFAAFQEAGVAKLVMIYTVVQEAEDRQVLVTHTAVLCPDRKSYLLFAPYWVAIRLASGFIRKRILKLVLKRVQSRALQGASHRTNDQTQRQIESMNPQHDRSNR